MHPFGSNKRHGCREQIPEDSRLRIFRDVVATSIAQLEVEKPISHARVGVGRDDDGAVGLATVPFPHFWKTQVDGNKLAITPPLHKITTPGHGEWGGAEE